MCDGPLFFTNNFMRGCYYALHNCGNSVPIVACGTCHFLYAGRVHSCSSGYCCGGRHYQASSRPESPVVENLLLEM